MFPGRSFETASQLGSGQSRSSQKYKLGWLLNVFGTTSSRRPIWTSLCLDRDTDSYLGSTSLRWSSRELYQASQRALYKTIETESKHPNLRFLSHEGLRTLLFKISGILNSRPLTYIGSSATEPRLISPNDFLNRPPCIRLTPSNYLNALPSNSYRYVQRVTKLFWNIWLKD